MESNLSINKLWLSFFPFIELLANAMMLITVFVGGLFIIAGEITPGQLAVFTSLSWALSNPMRELGNLINDGRKVMMQAGLRYQLLYPTIILSFVTIAFYLIGNAFSDAADPKNHLQ